jgi:signal transduction histidine kinase
MGRTFNDDRLRGSWSVPILALLGILLLVLLTIGAAERLRGRSERLMQAEHDANSLALLVDQHVERAFQDVESDFERIADKVQGKSWDEIQRSPDVWQFVVKLTEESPLLHSLELYDQGDRLRVSNGQFPTPPRGMIVFDAKSLRERFANASEPLVVGGPVKRRDNAGWLMSVGHAISGENGDLRGFTVGSMDARAIRDFFRWAPIGAHGAIELVYEDGSVVVSTASDERSIGQPSPAATLLARSRIYGDNRIVRGNVFGDGIERIVAIHPMGTLPFYILVELTQADVLRDWTHRFIFDSAVSVVAVAAFGILLAMLYRRIVSEQRAYRAARIAEQRLGDAVESIGQGFALWDADDRLVICNSRYREIHCLDGVRIEPGVGFEQVLEATTKAGLYKIDGSAKALIEERTRRHRNPRGSFEQQLADGRWLLVIERRTREGGVVGIRTDITALKAKETELRHLVGELEAATAHSEAQAAELAGLAEKYAEAHRQAERANAGKNLFLASMSHELRTPLNAIIGFSEMMMRETFGSLGNPKYKEYAGDVHRSGLHLLELIGDVLDLSKIEAGKLELALERQDVRELVGECVRLVGDRARDKGITLSVDLRDDLPRVRADRRAAKQILINLLSNAVKFTNAGGSIEITGVPEEGRVMIAVRDTGIGIAAPDIERLFRPFERGHNALRLEGTGLGLVIARTLAERNGGALRLESKVGEGTTAWFELPVDPESEPVADAA